MPENYAINYSCITDKGPWRKFNQDNFLCGKTYNNLFVKVTEYPLTGTLSSAEPSILGVFDGMGGEQDGELAALFAAETAAKKVLSQDQEKDLLDICFTANKRIYTYAQENERGSMGSTAAMLAFGTDRISLCNIGDSKIFLIRNGTITQISVDHLCDAPPGRKRMLYQNLGIPETDLKIDPNIGYINYKPEDRYIICSDGLTDMVSQDQILYSAMAWDVVNASKDLMMRALQNGGKDNITLIVAHVSRGVN